MPSGRPRKPTVAPARAGLGTYPVAPRPDVAIMRALCRKTGIGIGLTEEQLAQCADAIGEAVQEAAHLAHIEEPRNAADCREWCRTVGIAAREFSGSLHVGEQYPDGWAPWSALACLRPGIPESDSRLSDLLAIAVPTLHPKPLDEQVTTLLGRIGPALLAIATLADEAEAHWKLAAGRGGRAVDHVRRHLVTKFIEIYTWMAEQSPTVRTHRLPYRPNGRARAPGGPAVDWFRALFLEIGALLDGQAADGALKRIQSLCTAAQRSDTVADWLRDAEPGEQSGGAPVRGAADLGH